MKISAQWIIVGIDEDCLRMERCIRLLRRRGSDSKIEPSIDLLVVLGVEKLWQLSADAWGRKFDCCPPLRLPKASWFKNIHCDGFSSLQSSEYWRVLRRRGMKVLRTTVMADSGIRHNISYRYPPRENMYFGNCVQCTWYSVHVLKVLYHVGTERVISLAGRNSSGIIASFYFQFNGLCMAGIKEILRSSGGDSNYFPPIFGKRWACVSVPSTRIVATSWTLFF